MKQYVKSELTKVKDKNSSTCVAMIRENSSSVKEMATAIAEKYKKVLMTTLKDALIISDRVVDFFVNLLSFAQGSLSLNHSMRL